MSIFTCLPIHLSPSLAGGVRIFGCLFFAFTCLSSCVSRHVSPSFIACLLICLQASVCLSLLVVVSGSFACSLLCVFHHLSLTFCLVVHLSPKSCVSNHMSALVALSCSIVLWFLLCFVFVLVLYSLCVFLFSQDKSMFHHVFFAFTTGLPLVSYLVSLLFSQILYKCRGKKSKPCGMRNVACLWFMLFSIDMDQTLPASGASITINMHTDAELDMGHCNRLGSTGV
jgi:hypothetical protein